MGKFDWGFSLTFLHDYLRSAGIPNKVLDYKITLDRRTLHIEYFDYLLDVVYISVFRTSEKCFRIWDGEKLVSRRTARAAAEYINDVINDAIERCKKYGAMTLDELRRTEGKVSFSKSIELMNRVRDEEK